MRLVPLVLATSLALVLSACQPASTPAPAEPEAAAPEATEAAPPADDGMASDDMADDGEGAMADAPGPVGEEWATARDACLSKIAEMTGNAGSDMSAISVDGSEAGVKVMVQAPNAEAPWSCMSTVDGTVGETMYMGEG